MPETNKLLKLGARIKTIRKQKNMTQIALAIKCKFEKTNLSRIESGRSNLTMRTLFKICKALDIHETELFKD
jgi:transcriptional regulator with XRE-family HTH domain